MGAVTTPTDLQRGAFMLTSCHMLAEHPAIEADHLTEDAIVNHASPPHTDEEQAEAYDRICVIAREYALILSAAGGVVKIVHPSTQRSEGVRDHIQWVHGLGKHPETIARDNEELKRRQETNSASPSTAQPELF